MDDLIKRIFANEGPEPPETVINSLKNSFGEEVLNLEWSYKDSMYEALFYVNMKEHLARFLSNGELLDYRINLPREDWPVQVKMKAGTKGEVMNIVEVHANSRYYFDIIVRDKDLNRSELTMEPEGTFITQRKL